MEIKEIKKILNERKINYIQLSEMSGVPLNTLRNIFSGRTPNPRVDTMQAIKHALGLDEKKPLADKIAEQVERLNIEDYQNLSEEEQRKIAEIFNATVKAFKNK